MVELYYSTKKKENRTKTNGGKVETDKKKERCTSSGLKVKDQGKTNLFCRKSEEKI